VNKPIILVVDDEIININIVVELLSDKYDIKVAFDGAKALEVIDKIRPDLILLDIHMPKMDGYELAYKLKNSKEHQNIPFIFLSSKNDSDSIVKGFNLGAVDYITKPFNQTELKVRVENHIKTYQLQKNLEEQKEFAQTIMDSQPNMILVTDGIEAKYVNKTILDFYHCKDLEEFIDKYKCVCHSFIKNDIYFHLGKVIDESNWIHHIMKINPEDRVVTILSHEDYMVKAFSVSVKQYLHNTYIINLNDISQTVLKQIQLEDKTTHDKLTKAFNREYFDQVYKTLILKFKTEKKYFALSMVDIDHFKKINDTYGHDVGDEVLKDLVSVVNKHSRADDIFIRWGGEEFVLILKVSSAEDVVNALEHIRKIIEDYIFKVVGEITCSFGATILQEEESIDKTIKRADIALYEAKNNGRNQVVFH